MPRESAILQFFRREYRLLVKVAMAVVATVEEAHDAAGQTMEDLFRRWRAIDNPRAYARRAVVTNFISQRKRDKDRITRSINGGHVTTEAKEPAELTVWEDRQWVTQILELLPDTQRWVMASVLDGLRPTEIAELLGASPEAVRKNLQLARQRLTAALRQQRVTHQHPGHRPGRQI